MFGLCQFIVTVTSCGMQQNQGEKGAPSIGAPLHWRSLSLHWAAPELHLELQGCSALAPVQRLLQLAISWSSPRSSTLPFTHWNGSPSLSLITSGLVGGHKSAALQGPWIKDNLGCPLGPFPVAVRGLYQCPNGCTGTAAPRQGILPEQIFQPPSLQAGEPSSLVGEEITELCGLLASFKC